MKIICLMEDTAGAECCTPAHGLSFYIETKNHKLLMDAGPSAQTAVNAKKLGIDLSAVDIAILSHGHYDHADGFAEFLKINGSARVYLQRSALNGYFAKDNGRTRYIGINEKVKSSERLMPIDGDLKIDSELSLFTGISGRRLFPATNKRLFKDGNGSLVNDDFAHEQCLRISCGGKNVLFSGCAHNGVLNVLERYAQVYGGEPDYVISGFHLSKKTEYIRDDISQMQLTAEAMNKYNTRFVTCHCTGEYAYRVMKEILGEKLEYVHCGEEIILSGSGL